MDLKLFNAILSMDSYNRGYNAGIKFGDELGNNSIDDIGTQIGTATISLNSFDRFAGADQTIGFYALAYDVQGAGTIISYRGTDEPLTSIPFFYEASGGNDIWNGWLQGAGIYTSQAEMAFQFYNQVAGVSPDSSPVQDPTTANIITTGHSLGGGLAGANDNIRAERDAA